MLIFLVPAHPSILCLGFMGNLCNSCIQGYKLPCPILLPLNNSGEILTLAISSSLAFCLSLSFFIFAVWVLCRGMQGFSSCSTQGLLMLWSTGSVFAAHGLSCREACGIFLDQGLNPCPLHWQVDSLLLSQQGSRTLFFIHSTYKSLHLLTPNSHSIPPDPFSPLVTIGLLPMSVSLSYFRVHI